ncbi:Transcription factor, T-box family and p53-like transcription factor, DNA-binding domain-containing protein [Strongyloides ratti]|uniref:Transcription factor, T-box family and p53-like transcription factor, DNA-binding domain-containing protein n=1 Tax=Strongyloides ratti TaxID=34506 RepID=A0A090LD62_STRRB|nr:Transcription factor, T-box family and p53-like transcription factor, DNA-binding domain-containing protein [Strongyloides ratti]CEF67691.1 Transcription factor, T-box family and p53-like transcription factor, DNA-binding domain-containing protein [Strongyloides ratti]
MLNLDQDQNSFFNINSNYLNHYNQMAQNFLPIPSLNYSIDAITQQPISIDGNYHNNPTKTECNYSESTQDESSSSTSNTTLSPDTTASEAASSPDIKQEHQMIINNSIPNYSSCNESLSNPQNSSQISNNQFSEIIIDPNITVSITNEWLWKKFHGHTTEMIVTKSGRKMFPKPEYTISGLDPNGEYMIVFKIDRVDDSRYKYTNSKWQYSGRAESSKDNQNVAYHQDGLLQKGKRLMGNSVCFDRVKLTNNVNGNQSHIILNSMNKYQPKLLIFHFVNNRSVIVHQHCSEVMQFIAVTAYQNQAIINLKVQYNPFAKGFREGNGLDRKKTTNRKRTLSRSPPLSKLSQNNFSVLPNNGTNNQQSQMMIGFNPPPWPAYPYWNPTQTAGFMFNPMFNSPYNMQMPPY